MSQTDGTFLKLLQARYGQASRKEKSHMLDEFVKTTGYHRTHAMAIHPFLARILKSDLLFYGI